MQKRVHERRPFGAAVRLSLRAEIEAFLRELAAATDAEFVADVGTVLAVADAWQAAPTWRPRRCQLDQDPGRARVRSASHVQGR